MPSWSAASPSVWIPSTRKPKVTSLQCAAAGSLERQDDALLADAGRLGDAGRPGNRRTLAAAAMDLNTVQIHHCIALQCEKTPGLRLHPPGTAFLDVVPGPAAPPCLPPARAAPPHPPSAGAGPPHLPSATAAAAQRLVHLAVVASTSVVVACARVALLAAWQVDRGPALWPHCPWPWVWGPMRTLVPKPGMERHLDCVAAAAAPGRWDVVGGALEHPLWFRCEAEAGVAMLGRRDSVEGLLELQLPWFRCVATAATPGRQNGVQGLLKLPLPWHHCVTTAATPGRQYGVQGLLELQLLWLLCVHIASALRLGRWSQLQDLELQVLWCCRSSLRMTRGPPSGEPGACGWLPGKRCA